MLVLILDSDVSVYICWLCVGVSWGAAYKSPVPYLGLWPFNPWKRQPAPPPEPWFPEEGGILHRALFSPTWPALGPSLCAEVCVSSWEYTATALLPKTLQVTGRKAALVWNTCNCISPKKGRERFLPACRALSARWGLWGGEGDGRQEEGAGPGRWPQCLLHEAVLLGHVRCRSRLDAQRTLSESRSVCPQEPVRDPWKRLGALICIHSPKGISS